MVEDREADSGAHEAPTQHDRLDEQADAPDAGMVVHGQDLAASAWMALRASPASRCASYAWSSMFLT